MFGINYLWNQICRDHKPDTIKKFVGIYTIVCITVALIISGLIGFFITFDNNWFQLAFILVGCSGLGLGFFGSIIYAYRQ